MRTLIFVLTFCLAISSFGQDSIQQSIKVYSNFNLSQHANSLGNPSILNYQYYEVTSFDGFSLAYRIENKWRSHEFELSNLSISKEDNANTALINGQIITVSGVEEKNRFVAMRYEYSTRFTKDQDRKFQFYVGIGAKPYFSTSHVSPHTTNSFPTTESYVGALIFLTPRLTYDLSSNVFLDLNIPINTLDFFYHSYQVDNPAFTISEQKTATYNQDILPPIYSSRLGIGIRI